jgi:hypothetical protein
MSARRLSAKERAAFEAYADKHKVNAFEIVLTVRFVTDRPLEEVEGRLRSWSNSLNMKIVEHRDGERDSKKYARMPGWVEANTIRMAAPERKQSKLKAVKR